jgi:carbon storage regulator
VLVLTRKADQRIIINPGPDQVLITIVEVREKRVRVGIEAPNAMPVHRLEVWDAMNNETGEGVAQG